MATLESLREYGANVDEGLGRCMNKEDFYLKLVGMAQADTGYDALRSALDAGDLKAAFEAAHALKGTLANLAITPLFEPTNEICELLRAETDMDYAPLLQRILSEREKFIAL